MRAPAERSRQDGIGIIEVIVAMFILAIVSLILLPVFASTLKLASKDITVGRASNISDEYVGLALQYARVNPYCTPVTTNFTLPRTTVPGAANSAFTYSETSASCPTTYPGTMLITITVYDGASGSALATAKTLVAVTAAAAS